MAQLFLQNVLRLLYSRSYVKFIARKIVGMIFIVQYIASFWEKSDLFAIQH